MSPMGDLRYVQINLQHNKAATALLARALKDGKYDIALIQEPYIYKGDIKGLNNTGGTLWYSRHTKGVRTCIYTRNGVKVWPLHDFCSRDLTAVTIETGGENQSSTIITAAAYLPYEEANPISTLLEGLVNYGSRKNMETIIGCDANAHHVIWGSSDTNKRGEKVLEYLVSSSLQLLNRGNSPTFVNARRGEVIDITLATNMASRIIDNWHVSNEVSLSDHRYICFRYKTNQARTTIRRRNPKNTDWIKYRTDLKIHLGDPKFRLNSILDIEFEADRLENALTQAWTDNCPEREIKPKKVPWWNKELETLRRETRTAFNRARAKRDYSDYSKKLTEYHKAVRKSKRQSWHAHCDQISSLPEGMRLAKALSLAKETPLTSVRDKHGKLSESGKETLRLMTNEHFPGCMIINECPDDNLVHNESEQIKTSRAEWNIAKKGCRRQYNKMGHTELQAIQVTWTRWHISHFTTTRHDCTNSTSNKIIQSMLSFWTHRYLRRGQKSKY